jgi:integrase
LRSAICATRSKGPAVPRSDTGHAGPSISPASMPMARPPRAQAVQGSEPMTPKAFHGLFARIGKRAGMPFPVHPHMLRHGCGFALANACHDTRSLQAWLGHRNIQHTVRYTELAPNRFKDFWR